MNTLVNFVRAATVSAALIASFSGDRAHAAERAIDKEIVVNATLGQAWDAWTTREGIVSFFAPDARVEAHVGGPFEIYMNPYGSPGEKGADDMRFMAVQPQRMISFDWNAPPHLPEARAQRTFVIVRFTPVTDAATRVSLHHTGWGDGGQWDEAYAYFDVAWGHVLEALERRFERGPADWSEWLARLREAHDGS
jgi:uncharacterized protein YndB with AHSA1/START domain